VETPPVFATQATSTRGSHCLHLPALGLSRLFFIISSFSTTDTPPILLSCFFHDGSQQLFSPLIVLSAYCALFHTAFGTTSISFLLFFCFSLLDTARFYYIRAAEKSSAQRERLVFNLLSVHLRISRMVQGWWRTCKSKSNYFIKSMLAY